MIKFTLKALIAIWIFLGSAVVVQGQFILRFLVTETGGQPVVGANVLLYEGDSEEFSDYGVTSRDGFVEFRNLSEGRYRARVSFIGFESYEEWFEIGPAGSRVERITLQGRVGELGEIEVTARGGYRTGEVGVTRIRGEEFNRVPSVGLEGDLMAYIQTQPGVVTTGDQGGDLYIRGGTPAQNLVLVDNIPLVKPFHISNLFSAFPERAVNDVSVMAGGFDNRYMNSTSSVIDVNLKPGDLNRASVAGSLSPYMASLFFEMPLKKGKSSLMVNGRHSTIRSFDSLLPVSQPDATFYDLIARYTVQAGDLICSATAIRTGDEGGINPQRNLTLRWQNTGAGIRCFGFDTSLEYPFEMSAGFSDYTNSESTPITEERSSGVTQGFLRFDGRQEFLKSKIDYGVNVMFQNFRASVQERFQLFENGFDVTSALIQIYVKSAWDIRENFTIEPGIGTQISNAFGGTLEPRIRIKIHPFGSLRSEISYAAGYYSQSMEGITDQRDAGSVFTIYSPTERDDPMPGAWHNILGFSYNFRSDLSARIELFHKRHLNIPIAKWTPQTGISTDIAIADGISYGGDAIVEFNRPSIYLFASYGYSWVEYTASGDDLGSWLIDSITEFHPAHDLRHKFNTILNYTFNGFTAGMRWELRSGLPYTRLVGTDFVFSIPAENPINYSGRSFTYYEKPYTERLPVYHRLDVSLKRFFNLSSTLRLGAEVGAINLYDQKNVFYVDVAEFQVVNQTLFLPYLSVSLGI